jgi:hypothetical protein
LLLCAEPCAAASSCKCHYQQETIVAECQHLQCGERSTGSRHVAAACTAFAAPAFRHHACMLAGSMVLLLRASSVTTWQTCWHMRSFIRPGGLPTHRGGHAPSSNLYPGVAALPARCIHPACLNLLPALHAV